MTIATPSTPTTVPRTAPWRSANGRRWILQAVLAVGFAMAAAPKVGGDPYTVSQLAELGIGAGGVRAIGVLEVAGVIALLVPRLCGLAALAFVALMLGAVGLTIVHLGVLAALVPLAFLALAAVVAWVRRDRTAQLLTAVLPLHR